MRHLPSVGQAAESVFRDLQGLLGLGETMKIDRLGGMKRLRAILTFPIVVLIAVPTFFIGWAFYVFDRAGIDLEGPE